MAPEDPPPKATGRPGYEVPAGISDAAKERYERLHKFVKESHAMLDPVKVPACKLADCEDDYRKAAQVMTDVTKDLRLFYMCPGSSEEAKAFEPHKQAHLKHLRERMATLDEGLATAAGEQDSWKKLKTDIAMSKPTPCLSFACPDW